MRFNLFNIIGIITFIFYLQNNYLYSNSQTKSVLGYQSVVVDSFKMASLAEDIYYLIDVEKKLSVNKISKKLLEEFVHNSKGNTFVTLETKGYVWLRYDFMSRLNHVQTLYLDVLYPDINEITFYHIIKNTVVDSFLTGDYYKFSQRPLPLNNFVYPIRLDTTETINSIIIKIENHSDPLILPVYLFGETEFHGYMQKYSIKWIAYFTIFLCFLILAFIVYIINRSKLNLYYLLYLSVILLFLFNQKGYGFQFLYPNVLYIRMIDSLAGIGLINVSALIFGAAFLNLKKNHNVLYKLSRILIFSTIILLIGFFIFISSPENIMMLYVFLYLSLLTINCIFILYIGIYTSIVSKTLRCYAYFTAYFFVTLGFIGHFLMFAGVIPGSLLLINAIHFSTLIEMFIFSSYLTYLITLDLREKYQLTIALKEEKEKALHHVLNGQEAERKRLSRELHDSLGGTLSSIKHRLNAFFEKNFIPEQVSQYNKIITYMDAACDEVRTISHDLSPNLLDTSGLVVALENLAERYNSPSLSCRFNKHIRGSLVTHSNELAIYRICQELINNASKHAKASELLLGLIEEDKQLLITVKDNGIGFEPDEVYIGLGLQHIRSRIQALNAKIEINSKPNKGTLILIEIPKE